MRKFLVFPLVLLILAVGFSSSARATPGTEGSGSETSTTTSLTTLKQADGNTFYSSTYSSTVTGFLEGSCSGGFTFVVHADGSGNFTGSETCSGTVAGQPGTFTRDYVGAFPPGVSFQNHGTLSGTGALAGLHGTETTQGNSTPTGDTLTYTAQVHFDP